MVWASLKIFAQVCLAAKALGVDLVDVLGARGSGGEPAVVRAHLEAADGGFVARRVREHLLDALAGELRCREPASGRACRASSSVRASRAHRCDPQTARRDRRVERPIGLARDRGRVRAVISADSSAGTIPSLSVLHAPPSSAQNEAPALSSPPKPRSPDEQPGDEPFEADRHLVQRAARAARPRGRSWRC